MHDDYAYVSNNRHIVNRLLILLEDRRLLRERLNDEDQVYCRKSADSLRGLLSNEMLAVDGGGELLEILGDLRRACTAFVSSAGAKSKNFIDDDALFRVNISVLREIFAVRVVRLVKLFDITPTLELQEIMAFAPQLD